MSIYKFVMNALRPPQGPLAKMVGAAALSHASRLKGGPLSLAEGQEVTAEAIHALQDQINAINNLLKLPGTVQVDGSALPFTPPGGASGDIQTNNGAGGFSGLASTGTGNAVRTASPTIDSATLTGTTLLAGAGGADGLIRSHPVLAVIELGSLDSSDVTIITNSTEHFRVLVGGGVALTLPNASPGVGTRQIYYDPGDGNRVKYAP